VGTTVGFDLTASGNGTELRFQHHGLTAQLECFEDCRAGWNQYLASLVDYVDNGGGKAFGSATDQRAARFEEKSQVREEKVLSDNIEIITRFELAFRAGDQATIDELCAPGFVDHNPAPDHEPTLAGFKQKISYFSSVFPDLEEDMQDVVASGDTVATRWVLTGSLQQEFMGISPSGQTIRVEGMNFYRLEDGRVTDIWAQFDGVAMMQQLGAFPA
jgi:steroid delta-isomerase-like uncharacterized protein